MAATMFLGPAELGTVGPAADRVCLAAADLCRFHNEEPGLAAMAGVELAAVEAKLILRDGGPTRVSAAAREGLASGRGAKVSANDLMDVSRLEAVTAGAKARVATAMAALDAAESRSGADSLGAYLGLAGTAIGLIKAVF